MPICELYHDNFQNYKCYGIPHAQLVIADIPYNIGADAYASNPVWYNGGDNKNGESKLAKRTFSTQMAVSKLQSICTFAPNCLSKSRRNAARPRP